MKRGLFLLLPILALLSCEKENLPAAQETKQDIEQTETKEIAASVVMFSEDMLSRVTEDLDNGKIITKSMDLNDFVDNNAVVSITKVFPEDERYIERHKKFGLHKWYRVVYDQSKLTQTKAGDLRRALALVPGVEFVEDDVEVKLTSDIPDDPNFAQQWGLKQDNGIDINVENVWRQGFTGDKNVIVVVTDSGIDLEHEDLKDNCIPAVPGGSYNSYDKNYDISPAEHGTHVAGIIAAVRNNGLGISGVAGGDAKAGIAGTKILSAVMFNKKGEGSLTAGSSSIVYGADNGAVISQNSWGPNRDTNNDGKIDQQELAMARSSSLPGHLKSAIDYFVTYAGCDADGNQKPDSPMKGGVVLFAAGNDDLSFERWFEYEPIIAVAAIDKEGQKASFSNYGEWVDICAPGVAIYSTVPGDYKNLNGTSMACPMVSAVAALVVQARGGMGFTADMLRECLEKGASYEKVQNSLQTGPLVDAFGAISYGTSEIPQPIKTASTSAKANTIKVEWLIEKGTKDGQAPYGATVFASKDASLIMSLNPRKPAQGIITKSVETLFMNVGSTASLELKNLSFEETYYLAVVPFNYGAVYAETYETLRCETLPNSAPVIESDTPVDNIRLKASSTLQIRFAYSDPDGHSVTHKFESASAAEQWTNRGSGEVWLNINGPNAPEGKYTAKLIVSDSYGLETVLNINYEIRENRPVKVASEIKNVLLGLSEKTGREISLSDKFFDEDGDQIFYEISNSSAKVAHVVENEGIIYITPGGIGRTDITVTAKDPSGTSAQQSFVVLIKEDINEISVYPTQVENYLYVGAGESESSIKVDIASQGGSVAISTSASGSAFKPASIDLSNLAPGTYSVKAQTAGQQVTRTIVKL